MYKVTVQCPCMCCMYTQATGSSAREMNWNNAGWEI